MEQQSPKISGSLRGAAIGATIAMIPLPFIAFFVAVEAFKDMSEGFAKVLVIIQFIGCLIWAGALTGAIPGAKRLNISAAGFGACIAGALIGGILQMIFIFDEKLLYKFMSLANGKTEALVLITLITVVVNLPLALGTLTAGKSLHSLKGASVCYFILSVFPLLAVLLYKIIVKKSFNYYYGYSSSGEETCGIVICTLLLLFAIICVISWWRAASNAMNIEETPDNNDDFAPQATYVEQPAAAPVQPSAPTQPQQNYSARPVSAITDEQKKILMGMSNQELTNVINNPSLYANPAFVEEAKKTLTKRQGWEIIKDYSDEQLLSIVHDNVQGFSAEVLDAASMELLARENATFINEVSSLTIPELQGILSNADSYYDGYIQLATRVLNERINNPGNAQA